MISKTYKTGELKNYKYVVVLSRYNGRILLSRHKDRTTWETQGGHIEPGETPMEAAKRELYEESGAIQYEITPLCDYWAGESDMSDGAGGMVFTADIIKLDSIPKSEMQEVKSFDQLPDNLTYPAITPVLFNELMNTDLSKLTEKELVINVRNYIENGSVFRRTAVRGVIKKDGKYLLIQSRFGDHKFPGGGMNDGETLYQTLVREVQEETGYIIDESTISYGLLVSEKRKGMTSDLLLMNSYYFFCDVSDIPGSRNLDDYEAEYDYQVIWLTLDEAIEKNESVHDKDNIPWIERDTLVMKRLIQKQIDENDKFKQ